MLSHTRTRIKKDVMNSVMLMMIMENQSMVIIIIIIIRLKNKSLTESLLFLQARKKMNSVITHQRAILSFSFFSLFRLKNLVLKLSSTS